MQVVNVGSFLTNHWSIFTTRDPTLSSSLRPYISWTTSPQPNINKLQGQDSPRLNLYYLSAWLALFQSKTLLVEKTVIVELGESWPRTCSKIGLQNYVRQKIKRSVELFLRPTLGTAPQKPNWQAELFPNWLLCLVKLVFPFALFTEKIAKTVKTELEHINIFQIFAFGKQKVQKSKTFDESKNFDIFCFFTLKK